MKKKLNEKQLKLLRELNTDEDLANLWRVLISDALDNALFDDVPIMEEEVPKEVEPVNSILSAVSSIKKDNSYAASIKNDPSVAASAQKDANDAVSIQKDPSIAGSIKKDASKAGSIQQEGSNIGAMVRALSNISLSKKESQNDANSVSRDIEPTSSSIPKVSSITFEKDAELATKLSTASLQSDTKKKMSKKQKKQLDALSKENSASTLWRVLFSGTFLSVLCDDYRGVPLPNVATAASDISDTSNASRALLQALSKQASKNGEDSDAVAIVANKSNASAIVANKSNASAIVANKSNASAIVANKSNASAVVANKSNASAIVASKSNASTLSRSALVTKSKSNTENAETTTDIEPTTDDTREISASKSQASNGSILKNSSRASALSQKEVLSEALKNEEEFKELWETAVQETLPKMLENEYDMTAKSYIDFHPDVKEAVEKAEENNAESRVDEESIVAQEADRGLKLAQEEAEKKDLAALRITDVFKVNKAKKQKKRLKEKKVVETRQLKSISEAVEKYQAEDEERQAADDKAVEIMDYKTRTVLMWSNQLAGEEAQGDDADNTEVVIVRKGKKKKRDKRGVSSDSTLSKDTSKWSRGSTTVASASVAESETTGGRKYGLSKKYGAKSRSRAE